MIRHHYWLATILILLHSTALVGQNISRKALEEVRAKVHTQIENGNVAGAAHIVVHQGQVVYFEVAGVSDIEDKTPLEPNTIMRVYSMSKPITSVAAMTLYEQGKFQLDDPVAKFIAAFSKTTVFDADTEKIVSANRPITIRDVFRHTTGYSYGRGGHPKIREHYKKEGMQYHPPHGMMPPKMTIADAAEALARIPAYHHPGERFTYGYNIDLLGRLIEVWSGQTLDAYLQQSILKPLGMNDTGFSVPAAKRDRFASCHSLEDGKLVVADKAIDSPFCEGFEFLSGGGGLVSTMQDYATFCQMLANRGVFQGNRLLKESTVQLIFTNQLATVPGDLKFGLGFAIAEVTLGSGDTVRKATQYSWGGYASTDFRIVPEAGLVQVFMRQLVPSSHALADELFPIVYAGVK